MTSFFKKINTLVRSQLNDLVDFERDDTSSRSRRNFLARQGISRGLQNDVKALRARIDDALAYEDELQGRINSLYDQIAEWDQQADAAVQEGREDDARRHIGRVQQAQREIEMTEANLREHRYVTQELMAQVAQLEAVVEQAQREESSTTDSAPSAETSTDQTDTDNLGQQIMQRLDHTRQQLNDLVASRTREIEGQDAVLDQTTPPEQPAPRPSPSSEPTRTPRRTSRNIVDDDLASRLARLSKPEDDDA